MKHALLVLFFILGCIPVSGSTSGGTTGGAGGTTGGTNRGVGGSAGDSKQQPSGSAQVGQPCGGKQGLSCAEGLVCNMTEEDSLSCGTPDRAGVCVAKPEVCTMDFRPVCGCDGKTYNNDCARLAAGVARAKIGACEEGNTPTAGAGEGATCGGIAGIQCGEGLFCNMTEADGLTCQTADRSGTCAPIPQICTKDYRPVCGCDGKTYGNDCTRQAAGVARAKIGACEEETGSKIR